MKVILFSSLFIALAFTGFIQQSDLNVDFNHPDKVQPGTSFDLKVIVSKKDISNFARLQLELPKGFSAQIVDGHNGTFSTDGQLIKLIWMQLPAEDQFDVTIRIFTPTKEEGDFKIEGKISYIIGNERQVKKIETAIFNLSNSFNPNDVKIISSNGEIAPITETTTKKSTDESSNLKSVNDEELIQCVRSINSESIEKGGISTVTIKVNKNQVSGAGKIIDIIPSGMVASEISSNGAIFSASGSEVKFLWMTLPAEEEFEISYLIKATDDVLEGSKNIEGTFSYLIGEETKQLVIPSSKINVTSPSNNDLLTEENPVSENNQTIVEKEKPSITNNEVEAEKEIISQNITSDSKESQSINNTNQDPKLTNGEVNYRVQICATKKPVSTDYFVTNNKVTEKIFVNMHEGWHKFTVGGFDIYESARNHRETVRTKYSIKGPFVTAYNKEVRITVQEALMITNQKWIP